MELFRPGVRLRLIGLALALCTVAWVGAACAPTTLTPAAATAPTQASAPTSAPLATTAAPAETEVPVGVDADGNFYRGNPNAPVKLIEFSDFQCPYCSRHVLETGPQLDATYIATGQVLHVFRHFPLDIHPNAIPAAQAAYCAGQQDPKFFWGMHDWLFANQNAWSADTAAADQFRKQVLVLGVDGAKFDTCFKDPATAARVQRDLDDGLALGIQGTPAFYINDWFISGAYPFDDPTQDIDFKRAIERASQGIHPPPTPTPFPTPTPLPTGVQFYDPDPARPGLTYDGSPSLGDAKAPLLMLAFEDLKEPGVAQYAKETEQALIDKYVTPGQMRILHRAFPTNAPKAAVAAYCAAVEGKFWEFRGVLLSKQAEWQDGDDAAMVAYAKGLGLDETKFKQCLADPASQVQIDVALEFGLQVGVPSVPAFLVVDLRQDQAIASFLGMQTLAEFDAKLQPALNPPPTPEPAATPAPAPTPVAIAPGKLASLPLGVDADGNFYRGDPNAPIKLIDFSDFQ